MVCGQKATEVATTGVNRFHIENCWDNGDSLAYTVEKALRDLGDKVPGHDRQRIEKQITDLREALKGEDLQRLRNLSEQLQQATYALNQQMYASGASGASGTQSGGNGDGDVVEGEFTEA